MLPLGDPLSSADSAARVLVLFVRFAGTMGPSDFLSAFMSAVPPVAFSWSAPQNLVHML